MSATARQVDRVCVRVVASVARCKECGCRARTEERSSGSSQRGAVQGVLLPGAHTEERSSGSSQSRTSRASTASAAGPAPTMTSSNISGLTARPSRREIHKGFAP